MKSFWDTLPIPFFVMAPMEAVTDTVYRRIIASASPPDVFYTEFTSCEGLLSVGGKIVGKRLLFTEGERPLVAQIWSGKPEYFEKAAKLVSSMGFDGIDINMGCPDRSVIRSCAGSGLINNPSLAKEIILATKQGAGILPVSVKTRLGFKKIQIDSWLSEILAAHPAVLTVHMRTTADLSLVPARWEEMPAIVSLRNSISPETKLVGNGDIFSRLQGEELAGRYGLDGVMIGRGIFHNLWIFNQDTSFVPTPRMYLEKLLEHTILFDQTWGDEKNFAILKKFYKAYVKDFPHASDLRIQLMETSNVKEVKETITNYLESNEV